MAITTRHAYPAATAAPHPVRRIGVADLTASLRLGLDDFLATPTQLLFLGIIYPIVGLVAARAAYGADMLPLIYPLIAGISLMGPIAAAGTYELSRRRERGEPTSWVNALDVFRSPALHAIALLGVMLLAIFIAWLAAAQAIYDRTLGGAAAAGIGGFLEQLFTTGAGWTLIVVGNAVGFVFAALTLTVSVVSIPMALDRHVSAGVAIAASVRAVLLNPAAMGLWGLIVAVLLLAGSLPLFVGLAVAMPVLGHATWHLYRRLLPPDGV